MPKVNSASDGPNLKQNESNDLILIHTADLTASAVDGGAPMIPQDKHLALRHLARKGHIAFPQCLVRHIGLIQQDTVYCHIAFCINTHHIPGQSDDALQKHLVLPGNAAKLGSFVVLGFQENQYISIAEGGFHAVAGNLDHR